MSLASGTRIGPYEITGVLGAGGMGEVYRAHDGRLGRDVSLKVLPEIYAAHPERLARFHRVAGGKVVAVVVKATRTSAVNASMVRVCMRSRLTASVLSLFDPTAPLSDHSRLLQSRLR